MKKINANQMQSRLKLGRVTVRVLSASELPRVAGGNMVETNDKSDVCSDNWWCTTGPVAQKR